MANLNDTDNDGTIDQDDLYVPGEVDLIKLVIDRPQAAAAVDLLEEEGAGYVALGFLTSLDFRVWKNSTKGAFEDHPDGEETRGQFYVSGPNAVEFPLTLWLEGRESGAIWVSLHYRTGHEYLKATLVAISKVQYEHAQQGFVDAPAKLYVLNNTTVLFKALKWPVGAEWPNGKPVWSGTSGASGTGETCNVTFSGLSWSATDYKTITVECGNSMTVDVVVFELEGLLTPLDNFQNRSTEQYGVEELVDIGWTTNPYAGVNPTVDAVLESGVGSFDIPNQRYDAGAVPGDVTIVWEITGGPEYGPCIGEVDRATKTVTAPSVFTYMIQRPGTFVKHQVNTCSAGFLGYIFLAPKDVSFQNVEWREGECSATATGFYASLNGLAHPVSAWWTVSAGNSITGCQVNCQDQVWSGAYPAPYSDGSFFWEIPWQYKGDDGVARTFTNGVQVHSADSTGRCGVQKKQAGPFFANASDPTQLADPLLGW